ncbi:MAG TPA: serine/threonine-protein kinase [Candidatus Thermoplasmatota archaeon]|nr:serine/threonine-protein kinase [Candidatus Thermoplasmatota archaeon]
MVEWLAVPYWASAVIGAYALLLSVLVLANAPGRGTNRALALLLFLDATTIANGFRVLGLLDSRVSAGLGAVNGVSGFALPMAYLLFVGQALPLRGVRFLRSTPAVVVLAVLMVVAAASYFVHSGEDVLVWIIAGLTLVVTGLVLRSMRQAQPGSLQRVQARDYLIAFAARDIGWLQYTSGHFLAPWGASWATGNPSDFVLYDLCYAVFLSLLTYGFLRTQLFDIDVRLRRGAVRTFLAAILVGVFFVASALAGRALESTAGNLVAVGFVLAAAITLVPLQKGADRLLERVLPGPSEAQLDERRLQVFGAALAEVAAIDGAVPEREARRLDALQGRLGITDRDREILAKGLSSARPDSGMRVDQVVLGRYKLQRPLGGPADRTWLAGDPRGLRYVVKRSPLLGDGLERATLKSLRHRNVVRFVAAGDEPAGSYVVLEHMDGGSLAQLLVKGPLPRDEWNRLAQDLLDGLAALHARGIVHRDLKPANVLFDAIGVAAVADFDVARIHGLDETVGPGDAPPVGTLRYMAPEQARGKPASEASDLFGAAATLFEALVGRPYLEAVAGECAAELRQRAAAGRSFPTTLPEAPDLRDWFAQALDPVAARRFPSAKAMRAGLQPS